MFGVHALSLSCPFRIRIQNEDGEEKMFSLSDTPRAVFGRKSDNLWRVNAHTVAMPNPFDISRGTLCTVLCGDGNTIDGALCDRFRIRFRTKKIYGCINVGFVHSKPDAM